MNSFKPTFLYIKQHAVTGLLYFGETTKDPETYLGSGSYWTKHIKKHGKEHVVNLWYCLFTDIETLKSFSTNFSTINNIVESSDWANLAVETGVDGGARVNNHFKILNTQPQSKASLTKRSESQKGIQNKGTKRRMVRCEVDGVIFESVFAASRHLGISEELMHYRCRTGKAKKLR